VGAEFIGVFVDPLSSDVQLACDLGSAHKARLDRYVVGAPQLGDALCNGVCERQLIWGERCR